MTWAKQKKNYIIILKQTHSTAKFEVTDNNEKTATKYENLRYNTKDIGHGDWRIIICAPISS